MDLAMVAGGLVLLVLAGDALVKGAVALALRIGVPALAVSLTIVAFGTSAPELLVAVRGALADADGLVIGNVVGSNTANVLLVLGVPALIAGLATGKGDSRESFMLMFGGSGVFVLLCFLGPLTWWHGAVLLAFMAGIMLATVRAAMRGEDGPMELELEDEDPDMPAWRVAILIAAGLVFLPIGAELLVRGAQALARDFGVPEAVIGLTIVAVGTSLPELATSVMATIRKQTDVVIGNVIGSNMFNLLAIMGIASFFGPIEVDPSFLRLDLWVMLAASAALVPFVFLRWPLSRLGGALFLGAYALYVVALSGAT